MPVPNEAALKNVKRNLYLDSKAKLGEYDSTSWTFKFCLDSESPTDPTNPPQTHSIHWIRTESVKSENGSNIRGLGNAGATGDTETSVDQMLFAKRDQGVTETYTVQLTKSTKETELLSKEPDTSNGLNVTKWEIVPVETEASEKKEKYAIKLDGHTEWMLGAASDDEKDTTVVLSKDYADAKFHWHIK